MWVNRKDRVWLDALDIAARALQDQVGKPSIEARRCSPCRTRAVRDARQEHRVEPFPTTGASPDVLGERLGEFLDGILRQTDKPGGAGPQHGRSGVRACIHKRAA